MIGVAAGWNFISHGGGAAANAWGMPMIAQAPKRKSVHSRSNVMVGLSDWFVAAQNTPAADPVHSDLENFDRHIQAPDRSVKWRIPQLPTGCFSSRRRSIATGSR